MPPSFGRSLLLAMLSVLFVACMTPSPSSAAAAIDADPPPAGWFSSLLASFERHATRAGSALALAACTFLGDCVSAPAERPAPKTLALAPASPPASPPPPAAAPTPQPAQTTIINQPVIERVFTERVTQSGISESALATRIAETIALLEARIQTAFIGAARSAVVQNLSDVTLTRVTGLSDADIPDSITASGYLPLSGGSLSGDLTLSGTLTAGTLSVSTLATGGALAAPYFTATSTTASSTFTNLNATNATITNATTTSFFSSLARVTDLIVDGVLSAASVSYTNLLATSITATNATSTRIDAFDYVAVGRTATTTIYGAATSTFGAGIRTSALDVTSTTASSTFANGINITDGCFAVDGVCMTGGAGAATWGSITGTLSSQSDLNTALNARLTLSDWYSTTTDALDEGSTNLYFTTPRATANFVSNLAATTSVASITALPNLAAIGTLTNATSTNLFGGSLLANTARFGQSATSTFSSTGQLTLSSSLLLSSNDAGALGASGTAFSDLFLASGGVVDWNAGDVTMTHAANTLTFDGASSGYIFSNGNVGIGDASPDFLFEVASTTSVLYSANNPGGWAVANIYGDDSVSGSARGIQFQGTEGTRGAGIVGIAGNTTGGIMDLAFLTSTSNVYSEAMRITSIGNVGIGSSSPSLPLSVSGNTWINGTTTVLDLMTRSGPWIDVRSYGAAGDGSTDDTASIQAAIDAATASSTIFFPPTRSYYRLTGTITVNKPLTLVGQQTSLRQATAGTAGLTITSRDVTVKNLVLIGPQSATYNNNEAAIYIAGTFNAGAAPTYIDRISVENTKMENWGGYGITARYLRYFTFSGNTIKDTVYAGIAVASGHYGTIRSNIIDTVSGVGTSGNNAYGIFLSRFTTDAGELTSQPRSSDVDVSGNIIRNVPTWEGLDTHGGERITFANNHVYNTYIGINVGTANNSSAAAAYAARDVTVTGNVFESNATDGSSEYGIIFHGVLGGELARGSITGNTVRGYGGEANSNSGSAVEIYSTSGVVVAGNSIYEPSRVGISIYAENEGCSVTGNTIVDPWSDTLTTVRGVEVTATTNNCLISGNSIERATKSATYTLDSATSYAISIHNHASNVISLGINRSEVANDLKDDGGRANTYLSSNVGIGTTTPSAKFSILNLTSNPSFLVEDSASPDSTPFIVDAAGKVGIGTTSPSSLLAVGGSNGWDSSAPIALIENLDQSNAQGNGLHIRAGWSTSDYLFKATHYAATDVDRFIIKPTGNVGVGTSTPWRTLSVTGTVGFDGLTGTTGAGSVCLDANKQLVYNSASDACLSSTRATKQDIASLSLDGLRLLDRLDPVSFSYIEGDGRVRYGFIAEDAGAVDPRFATYNASGTISGIDDRAIISVIVKAVKELWASVLALIDTDARHDAELAQLRSEVENLKAQLAGTGAVFPVPPPPVPPDDIIGASSTEPVQEEPPASQVDAVPVETDPDVPAD